MSLWILRRGHAPSRLLRSNHGISGPWWSPDGRVLAASPAPGVVRAFSATGRPLWKADGYCCGSWSAHDLFAVGLGSTSGFVVYDTQGHRHFATSGGTMSSEPSWSPTGDQMAPILDSHLDVWTAQGSLVLSRRLAEVHPFPRGYRVIWASNSRVIVGGFAACGCRARSVDLRTGKVSSASERWLDPLSPDRKLAVVTAKRKPGFVIGVAAPGGGHTTRYARIGACLSTGSWIPAASSLQFVDRTRSLVYQSWSDCDEPFSNLYSMAPDGSGVQRLTNVQAQETQPALSPDGSEIAYVWASATGLTCAGCSDGIRIASAEGTELRTLTSPENCTFDDSPTWSPDGSTILFSETTCDSGGELFTVPAGGGTPHDLGIAGNAPAWGPTRIAYVGSDQSDRGLWTANPDGSDRVKVAKSGALPAWSIDGRLAYLLGPGATTVVVDSQTVKLPFTSVRSLAWSPDGTRLVVAARTTKTGPFDVYTVKTDGTDRVRLTKNYDAVGAGRR
jgi:Tol biopolymer transport system component